MSDDPPRVSAEPIDPSMVARQLGLIIDAPAAASPGQAVALRFRSRFGDPVVRQASLLVLVASVGLAAVMFVTEPSVGASWAALVVLAYLAMAWAALARWQIGSGSATSVSIRAGGFEIVTPSSRTWIPAGHLVRWGLGGGALELQIRDRGAMCFDLSGLGDVPRSAIEDLFRSPNEPPDPASTVVIGELATSEAGRRSLHAALRELAPGARAQRTLHTAILVAELALFAALLTFGFHAVRTGRGATTGSSAAELGVSAAITIGALGVLFGVLFLVGRRMLRSRPPVSVVVRTDGSTIWFVQDDGIVVRFPVSSITRARIDPDQVVFVTGRPYGAGRVPEDGFVAGGRERLLDLLAPVVG